MAIFLGKIASDTLGTEYDSMNWETRNRKINKLFPFLCNCSTVTCGVQCELDAEVNFSIFCAPIKWHSCDINFNWKIGPISGLGMIFLF